MKERELKNIKEQLSVARAEVESERNRLTTLVSRLEANLVQQGSEVKIYKTYLKVSQKNTTQISSKKLLLFSFCYAQLTIVFLKTFQVRI